MPLEAAREKDPVSCEKPEHGGELTPNANRLVLINGQRAVTVGDAVTCSDGEAGLVAAGSPTVLIGCLPAARRTDITSHKLQRIAAGSSNVLIGDLESRLQDCPMLIKGDSTPEAMRRKIYDTRRKTHPPGPLRKVADDTYTFPGGKGPEAVVRYEVEIDGKTFTIIAPQAGVAAGEITPEQAAQSLATLNDVQRAKTNTVVLSPYPNPDDEEWKKTHHDPNHTSAASASNGLIHFYPAGGGDQSQCDDYMQHEAAHNCDYELYWADPANKEAWQKAIDNDKRAVSAYAEKSIEEDFAETMRVYNLTKGTPCEAKGRERFPARYAELDRLVGGGDAQ